jgi:hypothetical protein
VSDPTIEAAAKLLEDSLGAMREEVAGADPQALNWRPAGEDTNSIAVLTVHSLASTRWWLSVATGVSLPERDRPSEFLASAEHVDELLLHFDAMAKDCSSILQEAGAFDAGAQREANRGRPDDSEVVSAAWALMHALEHLREHVAHAQLTRQLWDQRKD